MLPNVILDASFTAPCDVGCPLVSRHPSDLRQAQLLFVLEARVTLMAGRPPGHVITEALAMRLQP